MQLILFYSAVILTGFLVFILSHDRVPIDGFGLVIGFIWHFNTQFVTTLYRSLSYENSVLSHGLHYPFPGS
jgi:hypothetical protein